MRMHEFVADGVASELPREARRHREAMHRRREAISHCTCGRNTPPDYDHAPDCPNKMVQPAVRAVDAWRAYVVADVAGDVAVPQGGTR